MMVTLSTQYSQIKKEQSETIAGRPHIDFYLHKLRMCLALEDVKKIMALQFVIKIQ